jgi:UrcA family protein
MNSQFLFSRRPLITHTPIGSLYLALSLGIAPLPVIADPQAVINPVTESMTVSFADLDLATPAGINAAHDRLLRAAQRLCHRFSDSLRAANNATSSACVRETLAEATHRFDALMAAKSAEVARIAP